MYINADHTNWDTILPFVTFAYNTATQRTTGYSPFFLVYGRQPTSPLDISFFDVPVNSSSSSREHLISRLADCRRRAHLNTQASQQERKTRYDGVHRVVHFNTGDEVLLWTPTRVPGLCDKFHSRFIGPYAIVEQTSPVNYRVTPVVMPSDGRFRGTEVVHVSRLKPFVHRTPPS